MSDKSNMIKKMLEKLAKSKGHNRSLIVVQKLSTKNYFFSFKNTLQHFNSVFFDLQQSYTKRDIFTQKPHAKTIDNPHHNALTETASTGSLLHLLQHNNRGADRPVSTIPALFVRGRRPFLFYAAFLCSGNSSAGNQEQAL